MKLKTGELGTGTCHWIGWALDKWGRRQCQCCYSSRINKLSVYTLIHLEVVPVFPTQTTEGSEQRCSPCSESFWNGRHFFSSFFSSLVAQWFTDTVQTHFSLLNNCLNCSWLLDWTWQSGTLSLMKSGHPTPSHPSNHHLNLFQQSYWLCVWRGGRQSYWLCVFGGGEGERERERERERESASGLLQNVRVFFLFINFCFM